VMRTELRRSMRSVKVWLKAGSIAMLFGVSAAQGAEKPNETSVETIFEQVHSPLPLYTFDWKNIWPQSLEPSNDVIAGCTSRVSFGDWKFTPANSNEDDDDFWIRIENYGVFHCSAIIEFAEDRASFAGVKWKYGFFVKLGNHTVKSKKWELWAIQQGIIPGSEYLLMAREAGDDSIVKQFVLLQQRCSLGQVMEVKNLDVWNSRYCRINTRAELLAMARKMLRLPARGELKAVPEVETQTDKPDKTQSSPG
jgi:hypothetical protein